MFIQPKIYNKRSSIDNTVVSQTTYSVIEMFVIINWDYQLCLFGNSGESTRILFLLKSLHFSFHWNELLSCRKSPVNTYETTWQALWVYLHSTWGSFLAVEYRAKSKDITSCYMSYICVWQQSRWYLQNLICLD